MQKAFRFLKEQVHKKYFPYCMLFCIHLILVFIAFTKHFLAPLNTVFTGSGDGLKNNFTLYSFVKEPIGQGGVFKYGMMNYPFGDYVYATDNTPFFSVPFRWFCHHIYDISDYSLGIFNFFMIANIIVCGLLVFFIFRRLLKSPLIAWLLAVILPWTNFQLPRLYWGHYNLSLTSFCVFAMLLFFLWGKYFRHKTRRRVLLGIMILFSYCCFLTHGYYIAIIPVFLSAMLFFFGLFKWIKKEPGWFSVISALLVTGLTGLAAFITMLATDGYFQLRQTFARGYDWMEQKTNFSLLFTHYRFHHFFFPVWSTKNANSIELMCYLGNIGLYAMGIFFLGSVFSRNFRILLWNIQKDFFKDPVKAGIIFGGLVLLSMSFGENYYPLMQPLRLSWPFSIDGSIKIGELIFMIFAGLPVFFLTIRILRSKDKLIEFPSDHTTRKIKIFRALVFYIVSAMVLFVMFGHYSIWYWVNMTNPLWMAHQFTRVVEQFRSMVRFAWPFYWSFYVWIGFTISAVYLRVHKSGKLLIIALIILLGGSETIDFISEIKKSANRENVLSRQGLESFNKLNLDFKDYQAVLPIPYYNAGSEDYNNTIDDISEWSKYSFRLSEYSHLPLMSGKMARTPPEFAHLLLNLLIKDSIPKAISEKLTEKPILVAVDRKYLNDSTLSIIPGKEEKPNAYLAFWKSNDFVARHSLRLIDSLGSIYFYKWKWQENR